MTETVAAAQVDGQRVILRVTGGPLAYTRAIIELGQTLRVGRGAAAGLAVPSDQQLSDSHFEISWDGRTCHLTDLVSATGTLLDGVAVASGELTNGSWLRAGASDFVVYFEGASLQSAAEKQDPPVMEQHKAAALEFLKQRQEPLFAVLDAARDGRVLSLLRESVEDYRSLYEGPRGEALAEVAPYLVSLPRNSRLLDALVRHSWGNSWGIYLTSPLPLLDTRRHLRKLLMVELEGSEGRHYFRFYDPRVLRLLIPIFSSAQRQALFGPISCLLLESAEGDLLQLSPAEAD
jgi:pSer/pThr/pTyr-binding forkhead associated (FHA) protein